MKTINAILFIIMTVLGSLCSFAWDSKMWTFEKWGEYDIIEKRITIDGLTASSSISANFADKARISVLETPKVFSDDIFREISLTHEYTSISEKIDPEYNHLGFDIDGPCTIYVVASANGRGTPALIISTGEFDSTKKQYLKFGTESYSCKYEGAGATRAYVGIDAGVASIYAVAVVYDDECISFSDGTNKFTWGDEIKNLPVLVNNLNTDVAFASSDPAVATVNATGEVEVIHSGTTVISATATMDFRYSTAKYTLAIDKKAMPKPSISFKNQMVTIGGVPEGVTVEYSLDNKTYTEYTGPFELTEGAFVIARAVAPDDNYLSTMTGVPISQLAQPVIRQYNGTFHCVAPAVEITDSAPKVLISYDNGETWVEYKRPVTVTEPTAIIARATQDKYVNSKPTAPVVVAPLPDVVSQKTVVLDYNSFDAPVADADGFSTLAGTDGDEATGHGYKLVLADKAETWKSGVDMLLADGTVVKTISIKADVQARLVIPADERVNRLTVYGFVDGIIMTSDFSKISCGWKEVDGIDLTEDSRNIPVWNFREFRIDGSPQKSFDTRVFNFDGKTGEITFTPYGKNMCFVLALETVDADTPYVPAIAVNDAVHDADTLDLEGMARNIRFIPAGSADDVYYRFEKEVAINYMPQACASEDEPSATIEHEGKIFAKAGEAGIEVSENGNLTYFAHNSEKNLKSEVRTLKITGARNIVSGIEEIGTDHDGDVRYFNLQGVPVDNPGSGIYIRMDGDKATKVFIRHS